MPRRRQSPQLSRPRVYKFRPNKAHLRDRHELHICFQIGKFPGKFTVKLR